MADIGPRTGSRPVRRGVRVIAALLIAFIVVWWAAQGAHRGWSQDQVPVKQKDEVTGLEYVTYEKRYVPGVDVLGAGLLAGLALFAISFFIQRTPTQNP